MCCIKNQEQTEAFQRHKGSIQVFKVFGPNGCSLFKDCEYGPGEITLHEPVTEYPQRDDDDSDPWCSRPIHRGIHVWTRPGSYRSYLTPQVKCYVVPKDVLAVSREGRHQELVTAKLTIYVNDWAWAGLPLKPFRKRKV